MKKNILVFPCGSEIGLDIFSSVRHSTYFHLIGGSSVDDHGRFVYDDYIPNIPNVSSNDFIPTIKKIVKDRQIDAIYPTLEIVISTLKKYEKEIKCHVISSPYDTTRICLSKEETYKILNNTVPIPKVFNYHNIEDYDFPIFSKPIIGYGSRGIKIINNRHELINHIKENKDSILLEYLPGEEYTVDCFSDKERRLLYCAARKRNRIKNGISVNSFFVEEQSEFEKLAQRINEKLVLRGAWFFQVKRNSKDQLCLLEVASRLGGSSLLSGAIGVNLAQLSLFDAFGYSVEIIKNDYYVELDRALGCKFKTDIEFDSVYCDYDDCLILDKNIINVDLVRFLYKCINEGKKLFLLSKHQDNLLDELKSFHLESLFDKVINIEKDEDKVKYIETKYPIFIDDSFEERKNVKSKLNIPVFSTEMISVLM